MFNFMVRLDNSKNEIIMALKRAAPDVILVSGDTGVFVCIWGVCVFMHIIIIIFFLYGPTFASEIKIEKKFDAHFKI